MKILNRTNSHFEQITALYDDTLAETEARLLKEYQRTEREVETKLKGIYWEIQEAKGDESLLVSDLYRYNKYYDIVNDLNARIEKLGGKEQGILSQELIDLYKANNRILANDFHVPYFTDERAIQAMNTIWCQDGKLWSSRIWEHKAQLVNMVEQGMLNAITQGASSKELAKEIQKAWGSSWYDAQRLARTELAHIQTAAALDTYSEAGVEYYKVLTVGDPCPICEELAQKEWPITELVVPAHPNCRCCTIAVLGDE